MRTLFKAGIRVAAFLAFTGAGAVQAFNGNIGLYFDTGCSECAKAILPGQIVTLYVVTSLGGLSAGGITGAEYLIQVEPSGFPAGWFYNEQFEPDITVGGGALGTRCNVAWATCQTQDCRIIERIQIGNFSGSATTLTLRVVSGAPPANLNFRCPLFTLCDTPFFTKVCLGSDLHPCVADPAYPAAQLATCSTSGVATINPVPGHSCTVAVRPTAWSAVKAFYR